MIEEKGLSTSAPRNLGECPIHHPLNMVETRNCEGVIKFGRAVQEGTAGNQGKVYSDAAGEFTGIAARSFEATNLDTEAYADLDVLGLVTGGFRQVYVEEAVNEGDPVRIRHTADTGKFPGDFAKSADAGKTVLLTGAEFRSTIAAAGIATIFIEGPFSVTADV